MVNPIITDIFLSLVLPLARLTLFIALGLFIASLIENLNWTHRLALFARPLIRWGRLSSISGASFSVAFFSGVTANTMLAEAFDRHQLTKLELVLANLFNSLPRFFLHLPTVFFLTVPLIEFGAFYYVGLTFAAATLQTLSIVLLGRLLLPPKGDFCPVPEKRRRLTLAEAVAKSTRRLRKRLLRVMKFLIPVYLLFFLLQRYGLFTRLEELVAAHAWFLSWLPPESLGIVVLHVSAEFSAGLAAASVLLAENSLSYQEVVLALLAGNLLATPIRAVRHQLPYYTGIFPPGLAVELVVVSQLVRGFWVAAVGIGYYIFG